MQHVIRWVVTVVILLFAVRETGWFTGLALLLLTARAEVQNHIMRELANVMLKKRV